MIDGKGRDNSECKRVKGIDKRLSWLKSCRVFVYLAFEEMRKIIFVQQMPTRKLTFQLM